MSSASNLWQIAKSVFRKFPHTTKENLPDLFQLVKRNSKTTYREITHLPQDILLLLKTQIFSSRTHTQLLQLQGELADKHEETIKQVQLNPHTKTKTSLFPRDGQFRPVGWTLDKKAEFIQPIYGPQETLVYTAFHVNAVYSVMSRVLSEIAQAHPDFKPRSVLDFGAGPGTGSWAARAHFPSLDEYRVVEPSQSMVDVAAQTLAEFPNVSIRRSLAEMKHEFTKDVKYDLVMSSFVLSELPSDYQRVAATSACWKLVRPGGVLVLVDRGSGWGSYNIRSARQLILDSKTRARVLAPCTHAHVCPMEEGNFCHFLQRTPHVKIPKNAEPNRAQGFKSTKFSYVVLQKDPIEERQDEAASTGKDLPEVFPWSRLIRGPIPKARHVIMDLCMPNGSLERRVVTKGTTDPEMRDIYRSARKCHWGGLWPADRVEKKVNDD